MSEMPLQSECLATPCFSFIASIRTAQNKSHETCPAGQIEDTQRAYSAAWSPEEAEVVKRPAQGQEPARRKPAPLTVEAEGAAVPEQARRPRRSSSSRARVKLRPKPSSSAQVSQCTFCLLC